MYILYILYIYIGKSGTKFKVGQWVSQECMQRLVWSISKSYMLYYAILAGWYFHPPFFSAYKSWMMIPLDFEICDEWLNHQTRHSIYIYIYVCVYVSIYLILKIFGWLVPPRFYVFYTSLHKIHPAGTSYNWVWALGWCPTICGCMEWRPISTGRELVMVAKHMGFTLW